VKHRADELCFLLVRGRADLHRLRIFNSREIVWRGRRTVFYILGTSHAVSVEGRSQVEVLELLSCSPVAGAHEVLATSRVDTPYSVSTTVDDLRYECDVTPFALDGWTDRFAHTFPVSDHLRFAYGSLSGGSAPLTCVGWRANEELRVETVHTYPEEGRGVRSQSRIAIIADAR
jgi:hypothetical protein